MEPILSPSCIIVGQQAAIACFQECLNALTDEVRALKANVAELQQSTLEKDGSHEHKRRGGNKNGTTSWTTVKKGQSHGAQQ